MKTVATTMRTLKAAEDAVASRCAECGQQRRWMRNGPRGFDALMVQMTPLSSAGIGREQLVTAAVEEHQLRLVSPSTATKRHQCTGTSQVGPSCAAAAAILSYVPSSAYIRVDKLIGCVITVVVQA
jgi:hypothetical protein